MIPLLALIIATYAIARLLQTPIEMTGPTKEFIGLGQLPRSIIVACVSVFGIIIISALALMIVVRSEKARVDISNMQPTYAQD